MCQIAFNCVGLSAHDYVVIDKEYFRPAEVTVLQGNPAKAKSKLGWQARVSLQEMIQEMVEAGLKAAARSR